jgi:peptidoglycan/LPS O-acetylase OafA/YrhL
VKTDPSANPHVGSDYRRDIDGLRAVAVLAVLGYHAFPGRMKGGFVGVDIFFVISGFLISSILLKDLAAGRFSILRFYSRRVRRIFPALITVLVACATFGWIRLNGEEYSALGKHIAGGAGFIANLLLWSESGYFDAGAETKPLLHLWSLGVEEQFYLIWPMLLLLFSLRPKMFSWGLAAVITVSMGINLHQVAHDATGAFYSPASRFWELAIGATVALIEVQPGSQLARAFAGVRRWGGSLGRDLLSLLGGALLAVSCLLLNQYMAFPGWWAVLPVAGAALLILVGPAAWLNRVVLSQPAAVAIGLISYPLYLWHWPLLSLARTLTPGALTWGARFVCLTLAFVLATLTYQAIEKPLRWGLKPATAVTGLLTCMLAVGLFGYVAYADGGFPHRSVERAFAEQERVRAIDVTVRNYYSDDVRKPCGNQVWLVGKAKAKCYGFGLGESGKRIVLWGDSHGIAWSPVFYQIAREQHYSIVEFSYIGCPPLLNVRRTDEADDNSCADFTQARDTLASISNFHPDLTILVSRWDMYANGWIRDGQLIWATHFLTARASGAATLETSREALTSSVPQTVDALVAQTSGNVLLMLSPPQLPYAMYPTIMRFPRSLQQPRQDHEQREEFIRHLFASLADHPGVRLFDPTDYFCSTFCTPVVDAVPMYSDDNHISALGSLAFKQQLLSMIQPVPVPSGGGTASH